jgi:hypothetical protein
MALLVHDLGNKLLADLWDYLGIPDPQVYALDSYVIRTHYATRSYGGTANIDPLNMPESERDQADTVPDDGTKAPKRVAASPKTGRKKKSWKSKATTAQQRQAMTDLREGWQPEPNPDPRSRKYPDPGPTAPGSFTRIDPAFPFIGPEGRLLSTHDTGAANTFQGAGSSRRSGIVDGRDKHALVASGFLPDGTPFPPFVRAFTCAMGGSSKAKAGITTWETAIRFGAKPIEITSDRGYEDTDLAPFMANARSHGIAIVHDLNSYQRICVPAAPGVDFIDGYYFTAGMPAGLDALPWPSYDVTKDERDAALQRFDHRSAFSFRPMTEWKDGKQRLRGPACPTHVDKNAAGVPVAAHGMTVRCVNAKYFHLSARHLPQTACAKGTPCACSSTFTIYEASLPSSYEPLLFGTTTWYRRYGRRNLGESFNSQEQYHFRLNKHSIRVKAERWDLAHAFISAGLFILAFFRWMQRLGAWSLDDEHFDTFDPDVIESCLHVVGIPPKPHSPPG